VYAGLKSIIIYHTRFGNTERIAKSIEMGLKEASGPQDVVCINVTDVMAVIDSIKEYDLICVGAPTEGFTAPKPIKQFLRKIKSIDLSGKYGFAFDTKVESRLAGSAAKFIEKELTSQGLKLISARRSAIVYPVKEMGSIIGARLKEGEDKTFEQVGLELGAACMRINRNVLDSEQK
jgi:flavorubredoxin